MAYIKTDWVDNQTAITAARMNNIEDGIANNETAITQVETRIGTLSGIGQPIIATSAEAMTDTEKIYLYVGSEEGYETGHWYYYDTEWQDGGEYGAGATGISNNARNLLKYILERVAYTETGMQVYVNALYEALAQSGGGGGGTTTYMIMNALTHVTNSNDATGCDEGDSYTGTLTADTDYTIDSVTVTMGGVDITSTAYTSSTGVISISSVTGDVVITANAIMATYILTNVTGTDLSANTSYEITNLDFENGDYIEAEVTIPSGTTSTITLFRLGTADGTPLWTYDAGSKYLCYGNSTTITELTAIYNSTGSATSRCRVNNPLVPYLNPVHFKLDKNGLYVNDVLFDSNVGSTNANLTNLQALISQQTTLYFGIQATAVSTFNYVRVIHR